MTPALIALLVIAFVVIVVIAKSVTIVPQAQAKVVERLGRYSRTLSPGLSVLVPFVDRVRATIDLREQVISFPPQPVITADNLQVGIDTVVYFQVTDPRLAVYGIANYITGMEQLTTTTLRNESTLTPSSCGYAGPSVRCLVASGRTTASSAMETAMNATNWKTTAPPTRATVMPPSAPPANISRTRSRLATSPPANNPAAISQSNHASTQPSVPPPDHFWVSSVR